MRWILIPFIFLGLFLGLWLFAEENKATILFLMPPYRIEISAFLAVTFLILLFIFLYFFTRLFFVFMGLPSLLKKNRERRKNIKAQKAVSLSIRYYVQELHKQALNELENLLNGHKDNMLRPFAVLIADQLGAKSKRDLFLNQLKTDCPHDEELNKFLLAKAKYTDQKYKEIIELLSDGKRLKDQPTNCLRLLLVANEKMERYSSAHDVAAILFKRGDLHLLEKDRLHVEAVKEKLENLDDNIDYLKSFWLKLSKKEQENRDIVVSVLYRLIKLEELSFSKKIIEKYLDNNWDREILSMYPDCCHQNLKPALGRCESWLVLYPNDPILLSVLGQLCISSEIWGKANRYLCKSLEFEESAAVFWHMAQLCEKTGKKDLASDFYKRGLLLLAKDKQKMGSAR